MSLMLKKDIFYVSSVNFDPDSAITFLVVNIL